MRKLFTFVEGPSSGKYEPQIGQLLPGHRFEHRLRDFYAHAWMKRGNIAAIPVARQGYDELFESKGGFWCGMYLLDRRRYCVPQKISGHREHGLIKEYVGDRQALGQQDRP